jgi:flavodoxin
MAKAITIYDTRTGSSTETIEKTIEEGREKAGVEVISKGTANAKAEDPKDIDGQPTA